MFIGYVTQVCLEDTRKKLIGKHRQSCKKRECQVFKESTIEKDIKKELEYCILKSQ